MDLECEEFLKIKKLMGISDDITPKFEIDSDAENYKLQNARYSKDDTMKDELDAIIE